MNSFFATTTYKMFKTYFVIYKILFFGLDFFSYNGVNELKLLKHYLAIYFEDEPDQLGKISANISAFNKSDFSSLLG